MSYELEFSRAADKALRKRIDRQHVPKIREAIEDLAGEPRPRGSRKMRGTGNTEDWRIGVGDYRVVYRIEEPHPDDPEPENTDPEGLLTVLAIGHRQGVYG